jgi:hypothetical protein
MIKLRSRLTRSLVFRVFRMVTALFGCLFFLFSFVSPFCNFNQLTPTESSYSYHFWSFKAGVHAYWPRSSFRSAQLWYSDYWFKFEWMRAFPGFTWVLMSIFIFQILALASGVASIIFNRRLLSLAPVLLCLTVLMEMIYFDISLGSSNVWMVDYTLGYWTDYQLGYWLIYPSMVFFAIAFTMSLLRHKKKTDIQASKN